MLPSAVLHYTGVFDLGPLSARARSVCPGRGFDGSCAKPTKYALLTAAVCAGVCGNTRMIAVAFWAPRGTRPHLQSISATQLTGGALTTLDQRRCSGTGRAISISPHHFCAEAIARSVPMSELEQSIGPTRGCGGAGEGGGPGGRGTGGSSDQQFDCTALMPGPSRTEGTRTRECTHGTVSERVQCSGPGRKLGERRALTFPGPLDIPFLLTWAWY